KAATAATIARSQFVGLEGFIIWMLPWGRRSLVQAESRGSLDVPAHSVRNDFGQTDLGGGDLGDRPIRLAQVVAGGHAVHEPVLRLDESIHPVRQAQRPDHLQRVERKLFEELAVALGIGPQTLRIVARTARRERRPQVPGGIDERLVRLHFRKRLDAAARLVLGLVDEARELIVGARACRESYDQAAGQGGKLYSPAPARGARNVVCWLHVVTAPNLLRISCRTTSVLACSPSRLHWPRRSHRHPDSGRSSPSDRAT